MLLFKHAGSFLKASCMELEVQHTTNPLLKDSRLAKLSTWIDAPLTSIQRCVDTPHCAPCCQRPDAVSSLCLASFLWVQRSDCTSLLLCYFSMLTYVATQHFPATLAATLIKMACVLRHMINPSKTIGPVLEADALTVVSLLP